MMGFAAQTGQAFQAWLALVGAAASVIVLHRLEHRRPGDRERSRFSPKLLRRVINGVARVLLVAAIIAVLVALPAATVNLAVALALPFGVTEVGAWMGTRLTTRRAAHRATGKEQPSPGTARL